MKNLANKIKTRHNTTKQFAENLITAAFTKYEGNHPPHHLLNPNNYHKKRNDNPNKKPDGIWLANTNTNNTKYTYYFKSPQIDYTPEPNPFETWLNQPEPPPQPTTTQKLKQLLTKP